MVLWVMCDVMLTGLDTRSGYVTTHEPSIKERF